LWSGVCPSGWYLNNKACYYFQTKKASWKLARKNCLDKGADLVTLQTMEEEQKIRQVIAKKGLDYLYFWIGSVMFVFLFHNRSDHYDFRAGTIIRITSKN